MSVHFRIKAIGAIHKRDTNYYPQIKQAYFRFTCKNFNL